MSLWDKANKLYDSIKIDAHVGLPAVVGCALCRVILGYIMLSVRAHGCFLAHSIDWLTIQCLAELAFFVPAVIFAKRLAPLYRNGFVLAGAVLSSVTGLFIIGFSVAINPFGIAILVVGVALAAFGYALSISLWLEHLGCLKTKDALITYALAFFLNFLLWGVFEHLTPQAQFAASLFLPIVSVFLLVPAYKVLPAKQAPVSLEFPTKNLWRLAIWVAAFAFAYGAGDSVTQSAYATLPARMGEGIAEASVLIGVAFFATRFDFNMLYRSALIFMVVGLLVSGSEMGGMFLQQVIMSVSNETYLIVSFAIAWSLSYRYKCSSVLMCGLVNAINFSCLRIGTIICDLPNHITVLTSVPMFVMPGLFVILVVAVSTTVFREQDYMEIAPRVSPRDKKSNATESIDEISDAYGLSGKEIVVYEYLAKGYSNKEIADELFLAPSTIRAHASRIYKKIGVKTRQEFDELFEERNPRTREEDAGAVGCMVQDA